MGLPDALLLPVALGLITGIVLMWRRAHPVFSFSAMCIVALAGWTLFIGSPLGLLASPSGMLLLLVVGVVFAGMSMASSIRKDESR